MSSRDEYVDSVKRSFITLGKDAVMRELLKKVPFLSLPVVNPFAVLIVTWILTKVTEMTETGIFFLYIDMRVNSQAKEFEAAAYANRIAQISGTAEEKKRAEHNLKIAFTKFIRLTS